MEHNYIPKIEHNLEYCMERALEQLREIIPDATAELLEGDYEMGYFNDIECYINRKCSWEYPGTWYPGPVAYGDKEMIEYLVNQGKEKAEKNAQ